MDETIRIQRILEALADIASGDAPDPRERAARAVREFVALVDEHTEDVPPNWQPDLSDPAQALARRVQAALEREFDGEPLFPCCVVVQENTTRRVGLAATAMGLEGVDSLLLLGRGAARRAVRHAGRG